MLRYIQALYYIINLCSGLFINLLVIVLTLRFKKLQNSVSYFAELSNSPEPFACYACYQRSQLAVTKQLQSEVAHLKGEITKLSEQLATLTTASLSEATVLSQPLSTDTNKSVNSITNGPTYASTLKQAGNSANSPTSITHAQSSASLKCNNIKVPLNCVGVRWGI